MDQQPRFDAQTTSALFADGRSSRPPVAGTVARGDLNRDAAFREGLSPEPDNVEVTLPVAATTETAEGEEVPEPNWVREFPVPVTDELMRRGRERFNVYCAVCHGLTGEGNGLASLRALELQQGTWIPPTSLYAEHVMQQPPGQLFHTITHGIRKMPAYGAQIPPEDRWAIVLYLQALQRTQSATLPDVPEDLRNTLREMN
jgi:mono/diheme cytochrome c family protein